MKDLKALLVLAVAFALVGLFGVQSAQAANVTVTVTVAGAVGFSLDPASWAISGTVLPGSTTAMTTPIVINTSSATQPQTFKLNLTNPSGWTSGGTILDIAMDKFVMASRLKDHETTPTPPAAGIYANDDVLWSSVKTCDGTFFGGKGKDVNPGTSLDMYLLFKAPTQITSTGEKTILVTVASQ